MMALNQQQDCALWLLAFIWPALPCNEQCQNAWFNACLKCCPLGMLWDVLISSVNILCMAACHFPTIASFGIGCSGDQGSRSVADADVLVVNSNDNYSREGRMWHPPHHYNTFVSSLPDVVDSKLWVFFVHADAPSRAPLHRCAINVRKHTSKSWWECSTKWSFYRCKPHGSYITECRYSSCKHRVVPVLFILIIILLLHLFCY